jgi:diguanylate cyclase (GGDEF)-like protein
VHLARFRNLVDSLLRGSGRLMSFRTRLTSFFVLIVVVPMLAVGFLVFSLISDSQRGKADARANGLATAAAALYNGAAADARADAQIVARDAALLRGVALRTRLTTFATRAGLARVTVEQGSRVLADVGNRLAVAPGTATLSQHLPVTVKVSTLTAVDYIRDLASPPSAEVVVEQDGRILATTRPVAAGQDFPRRGSVTVGHSHYRAVTQAFTGFSARPVQVTVLSNLTATSTSVGASRIVAAVFIVAFLVLAFLFSIIASRALEGQIKRFLEAARRLGKGDFSARVPIEGKDEFAALGAEFNSMSDQLATRMDELSEERTRLQESIRRIGETFASNLDRPALLELALKTAADAVQAGGGRLSARQSSEEPLSETARVGDLSGVEQQVLEAERAALAGRGLGEITSQEAYIASVALRPIETGGRAHGVITVVRRERPFTDDDRELLHSLAGQATLALENVDLHFQVRRQAVTDELTGLANHGRFQDLLSGEIEQVRRYHHPVGLIMLDIDDFKSINDTFGHQQGDVVLRHVGRVLKDSSREADTPARYGGEEMALVLPHTDLEGSCAIAERVRTAIAELRIPRLDQRGVLRITASLGVAASSEGEKDALIAEADAALYAAKRQGKNRTMRAPLQTANVVGGE